MLMLWLILCAITAFCYSLNAFFDNYLTDEVFQKRKPQSIKVFNGIAYLLIAVLLTTFFGIKSLDLPSIGLIMLAGVLTSIASVPYYLGLRSEEATGAAIFYQVSPIIYLLADFFIFGRVITTQQIIAFVIIFLAPIIIIFSRKRAQSRRGEIKAAMQFLIYIVLVTISGIITTRVGEGNDFVTIFIYFLLGRGISDTALCCLNKSWRDRFDSVLHKHPVKLLSVCTANQVMCVVAEAASRYALIIGSAALVSVTSNSLELILTFVMGIILSIIWPKFGREKLSRHIVLAHLIATTLAIVGIVMLQF